MIYIYIKNSAQQQKKKQSNPQGYKKSSRGLLRMEPPWVSALSMASPLDSIGWTNVWAGASGRQLEPNFTRMLTGGLQGAVKMGGAKSREWLDPLRLLVRRVDMTMVCPPPLVHHHHLTARCLRLFLRLGVYSKCLCVCICILGCGVVASLQGGMIY